MIARRLFALAPAFLAPALALACALACAFACAFACRPSPAPAASVASGAAVQPAAIRPAEATEAMPAMPAAGTTAGDAEKPCYSVQPLDERRRKLECANGDRFVIRLADDGKWYPESKVRAGLVPGHESPEAAGKALCGCG